MSEESVAADSLAIVSGEEYGIYNGNIDTMITTMDAAGRLVLPKAIRERAQLVAGRPLEVRVVDGRVEIEPACLR